MSTASSQPMLTILTATFNVVANGRANLLKRCIASIAQLKTPHEHLILDGASNDGTLDLLNAFDKVNYPSLHIQSAPDTGIYNALNKGVKSARGKWIYIIGSDDYISSPETLDDVVREAESSSAEMVISPVRRSDGAQAFTSNKSFRCILTILPYSHQGVLMRKALFNRLGGFDEQFKISADYDICLRAHLTNVSHLVIWKEYALFEAGGASTFSEKSHRDWVHVTACALALSPSEETFLLNRRLLPLRRIIPLLVHPNPIIRLGARHATKRRVAGILGLLDPTGDPKPLFCFSKRRA